MGDLQNIKIQKHFSLWRVVSVAFSFLLDRHLNFCFGRDHKYVPPEESNRIIMTDKILLQCLTEFYI